MTFMAVEPKEVDIVSGRNEIELKLVPGRK